MASTPPPRRESPPALPNELVEEILLRLPPDNPASFRRASLVCKSWGQTVSHRRFRRRLHELRGAPPVLGFLHNLWYPICPRFISTTASSFSLAAPSRQFWRAFDCRHGRALFRFEGQDTRELLVWEPITGAKHLVPLPAAFRIALSAGAVVCAADGCDHIDCHGGPFRVVLVSSDKKKMSISACMYSSETGTWGEPTLLRYTSMRFSSCSSVLIGKSLLYFLAMDNLMLEYDMDGCGLALVRPPNFPNFEGLQTIIPIPMEDGGLGVAQVLRSRLSLWSREASDGSVARWVQSREIHLKLLLPPGALDADETDAKVVDYAEGANAILVRTINGIFTIELLSERAKKVCEDGHFHSLFSVVSFYTPVPRGGHQDPLVRRQLARKGERRMRKQ